MLYPKVVIDISTVILFTLLAGAIIYFGNPETVILLLVAFAVHETAHLLFAELFGFKVNELKLTPLGGCLSINSLMEINPGAEFIIAAAGPFSNLLMAAGIIYLELLGINNPYLKSWRQWNWLLGIVNLIPAVPLDGGRMLHACLKKFTGVKESLLIVKVTAQFIGGLFLSIGVHKFWNWQGGILYIITGIFILYQAFNYRVPQFESFWRMIQQRKNQLDKKGFSALKPVLVKPETLIRKILQRFGGNEFLLFVLRDQDSTGLITEEAAWDLLIEKGYDATFKEAKDFSSSLPK